eukprot:m.72827 g.72827  ORF g.72827 m.72827 type:complete len:71 (-) comp14280_c0_seq1:114-326(-)
MMSCWHAEPAARPTFLRVHARLHTLAKQMDNPLGDEDYGFEQPGNDYLEVNESQPMEYTPLDLVSCDTQA